MRIIKMEINKLSIKTNQNLNFFEDIFFVHENEFLEADSFKYQNEIINISDYRVVLDVPGSYIDNDPVCINSEKIKTILENYNPEIKITDQTTISFHIVLNVNHIIVSNVNEFKDISILGNNQSINSVHFQGHKIKLECMNINTAMINGKNISFNDLECKNMYVNNLYFTETMGIRTSIDKAYIVFIEKSQIENIYSMKSIDIFTLSECRINSLHLSNITENAKIDTLRIVKFSNINDLDISVDVREIELHSSSINRVKLSDKNLKIGKVTEIGSNVNHAFSFFDFSFLSHSKVSWQLVLSSAEGNNHRKMVNIAKYNIADIDYKKNKNVAGFILKWITGFGYKPLYTIVFSLLVIVLFAFAYKILYSGYGCIDSIYLSGMAFSTTGFGDIKPENEIIKLLTIAESILGILSMALFIFAMTKSIK